MLTTLILTVMLAQPTDGQLLRELATNDQARAAADLDGDGRIDDLEFDIYRRARTGGPIPGQQPAGLGGYDLNNDNALTPVELYPEADMSLNPGPTPVVTTGRYVVDDRTGREVAP